MSTTDSISFIVETHTPPPCNSTVRKFKTITIHSHRLFKYLLWKLCQATQTYDDQQHIWQCDSAVKRNLELNFFFIFHSNTGGRFSFFPGGSKSSSCVSAVCEYIPPDSF